MRNQFSFGMAALMAFGMVVAGCYSPPEPLHPYSTAAIAEPNESQGENIAAQQSFDSVAIFNGERYMFLHKDGWFAAYMICKLGDESILIAIDNERTDFDHNIIAGYWFGELFNGSFDVPFRATTTGEKGYIEHINEDLYELRTGKRHDYFTLVKAPKGFWSNAFLSLSK